LPPSGDRSKAVMVMVIARLLLAKIIGVWATNAAPTVVMSPGRVPFYKISLIKTPGSSP
jgi:hypothetical protein